jgi:cellulose synthase/poly-beta-1,6-N-acetylglucosamine synthase-like glycosyltransferase
VIVLQLGIYLEIYTVFLALVSLFLLANLFIPRTVKRYTPGKDYNPKVLVIIPCKGDDIELTENLKSAMKQDYRNYNAIAVVGSKDDSALGPIRKSGIKHYVANLNCKDCSGKVRSLAYAISKFDKYDLYVILDSDVRVESNWLSLLVAPLSDKSIGLATAYPIFEPLGGFWSKVKYAWSFVGQGLMEDKRSVFGWGGSLAFRKDLLSNKADFKYFSSAISDDIAITRIAKRKGLGIAYVPDAKIIVKQDDDFSRFTEWSNRQTALVVRASKRLFPAAVAYYSIILLLFLSSIILGVFVNIFFLLFLIPLVASAIRLYLRSGNTYMIPLYFVMNFIYLLNILKGGTMKAITWRGRTYDLTKI